MPRHPKPQILIDYEERRRPEFCHTCAAYSEEGLCLVHFQEPPEEFAKTEKACKDYEEDLPF